MNQYFLIVLRNVFNLINVAIFPLLIVLAGFGRYKDVFVLTSFAVINSLVAIIDEVRVKRRLDRIRLEFAKQLRVKRGKEFVLIPAEDVKPGDHILIQEGELIPHDGKVISAKFAQVDESILTGESNYLVKEKQEQVTGGSLLVTGELVYEIAFTNGQSFINRVTAESQKFQRRQSKLQRIGNQLTIGFIVLSAICGVTAYVSAKHLGADEETAVVALVSVVMLVIPQTLIFLFTFTFSISVLKLSNIGVLVQRGSAIETMSELDVICFDKTGTITNNDLKALDHQDWNIKFEKVATILNAIGKEIFGRNKTLEAVLNYCKSLSGDKSQTWKLVDQSPFTSRNKMASLEVANNDEKLTLHYGAASAIKEFVEPTLWAKVQAYMHEQEQQGRRLLLGVTFDNAKDKHTKQVWVIVLKEELNQGIKSVMQKFGELGTAVKIISGDSKVSVKRVLAAAGILKSGKHELRIIDLSDPEINNIAALVNDYDVFVRAKPEDKLTIMQTLQGMGQTVAMVGDGVNDVLALKTADLSIAMEHGSQAARDVADVVLLNNNFKLVPQILFEADNIISNLQFMNQLFLGKTIHTVFFVLGCVLLGVIFPLLPASLLIYSFFGTSLPSYLVAFARRQVGEHLSFWRAVLPFSIISAALMTLAGVIWQLQQRSMNNSVVDTNAQLVYLFLFMAVWFTLILIWERGYVRNLILMLLYGLVVCAIAVAASLIPLVRDYYEVSPLPWSDLLKLFGLGSLMSLIYLPINLVVQKVIPKRK